MKVILIEDVPKVGNRHDVKILKDGFAQNVLIARGLAILATPKALAKLNNRKTLMNLEKEKDLKNFNDLIKILKDKKIKIKAKCNEKEHLFKSISSRDIIEIIKSETNLTIKESDLDVGHIKELGKHLIKLKRAGEMGEFEVDIVKI